MTSSVVGVVGNLLEGNLDNSEESASSSSSIILSLERQIEIALDGLGAVHIVDPNIVVHALTIESSEDGKSDITGSLTFVVKGDDNEDHGDLSEDRVQTVTNENNIPAAIETSIQLPGSLFSSAGNLTNHAQ